MPDDTLRGADDAPLPIPMEEAVEIAVANKRSFRLVLIKIDLPRLVLVSNARALGRQLREAIEGLLR